MDTQDINGVASALGHAYGNLKLLTITVGRSDFSHRYGISSDFSRAKDIQFRWFDAIRQVKRRREANGVPLSVHYAIPYHVFRFFIDAGLRERGSHNPPFWEEKIPTDSEARERIVREMWKLKQAPSEEQLALLREEYGIERILVRFARDFEAA